MSTTQPIHPVRLSREGEDRLVIEWSDSVRHVLTWATLRKACPCAGCRAEREKPAPLLPVLKLEEAQPPRPRTVEPVGRYAYQIHWNDGHASGIYSFDFLRQLGEQSSQLREQKSEVRDQRSEG
jgi:DUF971 family protein